MPASPQSHSPAQLFVDEDRIQIASQDVESAQFVARRLLRLNEVRSVLHNAQSGEVTVCLRKPGVASKVLGEVALLAGRQSERMRQNVETLRHAEELVTWTDAATGSASYVRAPQQTTGVRRALLLMGAGVCLVLGAVGIAVPGLPTTPFLLLTSYCLLRSSRRLHAQLLDSKLFGPFLKDWHARRAVRPGVKPTALATMGLVVGLTLAFSNLPWTALAGIAGCAAIGATIVWRLPVIEG